MVQKVKKKDPKLKSRGSRLKELRPKMTKIASMLGGPAFTCMNLKEQKLRNVVCLKCYGTMNMVERLFFITTALKRKRCSVFSKSAPTVSNNLGAVRKSNFSELTSATRGCAWHVAFVRSTDALEAS